MISSDISVVLPEIVLAVYAMAALIFAVYTSKDKSAGLLVWVTSAIFVAVALWIGLGANGTDTAFNGAFIDDRFARFAKVVILLSAAAVMVMGQEFMAKRDLLRFEYPILITLAAVGMMMMVSAGDLMALVHGFGASIAVALCRCRAAPR